MKKLQFKELFFLFVFSILFATVIQAQKIQPVDLVNLFIDTGAPRARWFFFSSASRPFGMVNLSPDMWTKGDWGSGYLYDGEWWISIKMVD